MTRSAGIDALLRRLALVWAGVALGVAFVATPAKFLAPSLSLPVALDVGRHTFALYNRMELLVLVALSVLALFARQSRYWLAALAGPGAVVLIEAIWLLPALDLRVVAILAGRDAPPSDLHGLYIALEALKIGALLWLGLSAPPISVSISAAHPRSEASAPAGSSQRRSRYGGSSPRSDP